MIDADDLPTFLKARLDEEERRARSGYYSKTHWDLFTTTARLAAWHAWRQQFPREQWDVTANDRIADATVDRIRERITAHEADRTAKALRDIDAKRALIDDLLSERHHVSDDCWFTCAAATEERDGGESCDYTHAGKPCDCGRDARVSRQLRLLASAYSDHPDFKEEWRP